MNRMATIRAQLIAAVAASGLTIAELARRSGITRANVSRYLAGKADLQSERVDRLFAAMKSK